MRPLLLLTVANIKSFTRDRAALFWTLAFPLIFVLLFGSIFTGGSSERSIGFADLDGTPASGQLKGAFAALWNLKIVDGTEDELLASMKKGDVVAVIVVPEGYSQTVAAKAGPAMARCRDATSSASAASRSAQAASCGRWLRKATTRSCSSGLMTVGRAPASRTSFRRFSGCR